jgi:hypothetical protein
MQNLCCLLQANSKHEAAPAGCTASTLATFLKCGSRKRLNASHDIQTTSKRHPMTIPQTRGCLQSLISEQVVSYLRWQFSNQRPVWDGVGTAYPVGFPWIPHRIATECQQVRGQL